jgi:hypothetical protein
VGGKVHDRIDVVLLQNPADKFFVTGIPNHQVAIQDSLTESSAEVVQGDQSLTGFAKLASRVTANVTSAAGNQNSFFRHEVIPQLKVPSTCSKID